MGRSCFEKGKSDREESCFGLTANDGESLSFRIEIGRSRGLTASIIV